LSCLDLAFVRRGFEVALERKVGVAGEDFALQLKFANPVGAKVAHIAAETAKGDEMPVVRVIDQAERFDLTTGHLATLTTPIVQGQNPPLGEGALDWNQGFTRQSRNRNRAPGNDGRRTLQAVEII